MKATHPYQNHTHTQSSLQGRIHFAENMQVIRRSNNSLIVVSKDTCLLVISPKGEVETHNVPYGALLNVENGQRVKPGSVTAEWCPYTRPVVVEREAIVLWSDLEEGVSVARQVDEVTGITTCVVIERKVTKPPKGVKPVKQRRLRPRLIFDNDDVMSQCTKVLPVGTLIYVDMHDGVSPGDIIARIPLEDKVSNDI